MSADWFDRLTPEQQRAGAERILAAVKDLDVRCDVTDMPKASCAHCVLGTPLPASPAGDKPEVVYTFTASFPGVCEYCEGRIDVGDTIGRDELGDYLCHRCIS